MKTKLVFTIFLIVTFLQLSFSQKIELKKGKILLDNKEILNYTVENRQTEFTISNLSGEELLFVIDYENQTTGYRADDYYKINFTNNKIKLESSNLQATWKKFVEWLYKNKVFDNNGIFILEKIEIFKETYDEKLSEKTINIK